MRRSSGVLVVTLLLASCGGSTETIEPFTAGPLDPGFAKTWSGSGTMTCPGFTATESATMPITVSGDSLTASMACLGGSRVNLTATGSGTTASWSGSLSCPPAADSSCATWVYTRLSSTLTLNANGTLSAFSAGRLVGCGTNVDCTTTFNGT